MVGRDNKELFKVPWNQLALECCGIASLHFVPMAIVVFKHEANWSEALKIDVRVITLFGKDMKFRQRWKPDGKGGSDIGFGASIYPACILLTAFLETNEYGGKGYVEGKRVLELGCGLGLGGVGCVLSGAKEVFATDGDGTLLELIRENAEANLNAREIRKLKVRRLLWDCKDDYAALGDDLRFDVIIASDVVACPYAEAYEALLQTFVHFSDVNPGLNIIISYKRRQESESTFWKIFKEQFDVTEISPGRFPGEFKGSSSMGIVVAARKELTKG